MKKLTKQQMFNKAVLGVVQQGARSSNGGVCRYRMVKGGKTLACGVGHLIADDLYTNAIEGAAASAAYPVRSSVHKEERDDKLMLALCFSGVDVTDWDTVEFIDSIQSAHDCALNVEDYVSECRALAKDHGLTMPRVPAKYS